MEKQTIAIVGLGRIGSVFLEKLLGQSNQGIEIVAVSEKDATAGRSFAEARGIKNFSIDGLIAKGNDIDIIFDLTGSSAVRQQLREKLSASANRHTTIATESIAHVIWALISDGEKLPNVHAKTGY